MNLKIDPMSLTTFIRDIQKIHETIPGPGAIFYNATAAKLLKEPERKIAQDVADRIDKGSVVDLGSGTGYLSIEIAKRAPKTKVYGIDLSKKMVKIAKHYAKGVENAQFKVGNAAELPFEDNSIDFIVSTGSLHHWKKPVKVFDECYRILKSGKEVWIYDGYSDILKEQAEKAMKRKYNLMTYQILKKVLKLHGFNEEEYRGKIKDILEQTKFKDSYKMEQTDIWMKITAGKYT